MSELKARTARSIADEEEMLELGADSPIESAQVYLKSEADKVIAELESQKAQAEDDCAYWKMNEGNAVNAMHETEEYAMQLYNELRHQKYKRCLDQAEMCDANYFRQYMFKPNFWKRWHKRWLELAEKFKEAK